MKIFFSGPLFTTAERFWNAELTRILRQNGLKIILPQEFEPMIAMANETMAAAIFRMCKESIRQCDAILAIMDGPDPDSGTCFECGYAYANGKPIYTVRTDSRKSGDSVDPRFNLMLTQCSTVIELPDNPSTVEVANAIVNFVNAQ